MPVIRVQNVSYTHPRERADAAKSYGSVLGLAVEYASRESSNEYRHALNTVGKPIEPPRPQALHDVSLEIRNGEMMAALGPSGCGKTTLLKVIAGLIQPDSGTIWFDGRDMQNVLPGDRNLGIVFQDYALYPHMKTQGNIGFFFRLHNRREEIPERVRQVSEIMGVGFDALLSRKPPTLSGGERQRVALARCIARDPGVFLFDEPLSNLDAKLRMQTRIELKRMISRFNVTGLYVTHDQTEAIALCDRIAVMREGHIEQVGTFDFLVERPANTFVASFLGLPPMNIFEGVWTADGWKGADLAVRLPENRRHPEGRRGTLGIRPQYVTIDPQSEDRGRVVLIEPLVSERVQLVHVETGKTSLVLRLASDVDVRRGDIIPFSFDVAQVQLFDGVSGRRVD
jgi:ABC-type sugar transport system ATPase subunit